MLRNIIILGILCMVMNMIVAQESRDTMPFVDKYGNPQNSEIVTFIPANAAPTQNIIPFSSYFSTRNSSPANAFDWLWPLDSQMVGWKQRKF